jgi:hypothetical protein
MKCCKTRFELIIDAAKNIDNIVDGFNNLMFKSPEIEELAMKRAKVCAICKQNQAVIENGGKEWCLMCGCYIPAKIRSRVERCEGGLW